MKNITDEVFWDDEDLMRNQEITPDELWNEYEFDPERPESGIRTSG